MSVSRLPFGLHCYEHIIASVHAGLYEFAKLQTYSGRTVHLVGVSPDEYLRIKSSAEHLDLQAVMYGSRVAGPRTHQRTLHPVLLQGTRLLSFSRHASVTMPGIEGLEIPKNAIKELGLDNPLTSDISIALIQPPEADSQNLLQRAIAFEIDLNSNLGLPFPIRVYTEIFGAKFQDIHGFIAFGRERYIKRDLPAGHAFRDDEIEAAFTLLFCLLQ